MSASVGQINADGEGIGQVIASAVVAAPGGCDPIVWAGDLQSAYVRCICAPGIRPLSAGGDRRIGGIGGGERNNFISVPAIHSLPGSLRVSVDAQKLKRL